MLAPLTKLAFIKKKFKWTKVKHDAFDKIKRIVARDTLLTYTDFIEIFKTHTDDSAFQLGAVISQKGKPISFQSKKLPDYHQWYTVTDRELLIIV